MIDIMSMSLNEIIFSDAVRLSETEAIALGRIREHVPFFLSIDAIDSKASDAIDDYGSNRFFPKTK